MKRQDVFERPVTAEPPIVYSGRTKCPLEADDIREPSLGFFARVNSGYGKGYLT
jgi:hypothetical protein